MSNEENIGISFVNIPIEIFSSKELTANEKILYGYLSIFKKQCCFQSNEALAKAIGVSENTITNGLKHLEELGYVFVEFVNGNSAARRIYTIFDNPKKLKYLASKGYLESFAHSFAQGHKTYDGAHKNCEDGHKNCEPNYRGEGHKNCDHKIIKDNKNIETSALAFELPSRVSNKNISQDEYEKAFYARNTITI